MRDAERYDMGERGYVAEVARMAARNRLQMCTELPANIAQLGALRQSPAADDTASNQCVGGGQRNG